MSNNIPPGWHWGVGEKCGNSVTHWFYTNLRYHYQGEIYTDPGEPWTVNFYEEIGKRDDGDVEVAEYPCESGTFDTEKEAEEFLFTTAQKLLDH